MILLFKEVDMATEISNTGRYVMYEPTVDSMLLKM